MIILGLLDLHLYRLAVDEVATGHNCVKDNSNLEKGERKCFILSFYKTDCFENLFAGVQGDRIDLALDLDSCSSAFVNVPVS